MNEIITLIIKIILLIIILVLIYNYVNSIDPKVVEKENFKCDLDKLNIDDLVIINRNPEYTKYIDKLIDEKSFMFTDEQIKVLKNPNQFYNVTQSSGDIKNISYKMYNTCKDQLDTVVNTIGGNFVDSDSDSNTDNIETFSNQNLESGQQLIFDSNNEYDGIVKKFKTNIKNTIKPDCVNSCVMSDPKYLQNYYLDIYGNRIESNLTDYFADYYTNINIDDPKEAIPVTTLKGNSNFIIPDQYIIQNYLTNAYNVDWSRIVNPYTIY